MHPFQDELARQTSVAVAPTRTDIVRAKRTVMEELRDGAVRKTRDLIDRILAVDGVAEPERNAKLTMQSPEEIGRVAVPDHPLLKPLRGTLATAHALEELALAGDVVPCAVPDGPSGWLLWEHRRHVAYQIGGYSAGFYVDVPFPDLAAAYRLAPVRRADPTWFLDPDLFLGPADALRLGARTRRCVEEALVCYRRGLYLACLNMLGAAVEGAWFTAAERLRSVSTQVDKELAEEQPKAARVQRAVVRYLDANGQRLVAAGLDSHATLMRAVRNYGLHARAEDEDLERFFDEATCGALLLSTHRHLADLASAVDNLTSDGTVGPEGTATPD